MTKKKPLRNNLKGKKLKHPSKTGPWKQFRDLNIYANPLGELKYKKGKSEFSFRTYDFCNRNCTTSNKVIITKDKRYFVKNIVWECFNEKIPDGYSIVHKLGYKNDSLSNLRMVNTTEYCRQHSKTIRTRFVIDKTHNVVYKGASIAAKHLKISKSTVIRYCNGKIKEPAYDLEWGGLISGKGVK